MTEVSPAHVESEPKVVVDMPAVQARMLLTAQKYLNPAETTKAPELNKDTVSSFANRNYSLFQEASKRERKAQQENPSTPFEKRYEKWSNEVLNCFNAESNKQKVVALKSILGIKTETVDATDIQRLYDKYLDASSPASGIKAFVADVVEKYTKNNSVDIDALNKDRQSLLWMGQLFGSTSAVMIDQLIRAEVKLKSNPEQCYKTLNETVNNITSQELEMMKFIYNAEVVATEKAVENGMLPVEAHKKEIQDLILSKDCDRIIISAGTGAGKTTKIPQYIYELLQPGENIAVTQPRRLPTENLAATVAKQMGVTLGKEVGYSHGKGKMVSKKDTKMLFTVEKSLLIQLSKDPMLTKYNYVMVDEWHERHKDTDMLVGLLLRAQELRKKQGGMPPLKLIITSATMNRVDLQRQLGESAKSLEIEGSSFKRNELFEKEGSAPLDPKNAEQISDRAAIAALEMVKTRPPGRNILIFMPGDDLIMKTFDKIKLLKELPHDVVIDKLIGTMTREQQEKAIDVSDGKKHIIIASPLAETSLTIKQVDVISSGIVNVPNVDPKTGLYYLVKKLHTRKGLMQQMGRTGRESDGEWRFLGTKKEYEEILEDHEPAEILRSDLSDEILLLKKMGLTLDQIQLVDKDKLEDKNIARADRRLKDLGALDKDGNITEIGKDMVDIPFDIHYSRMLVEAQKRGCINDAVELAVICTQTDLSLRLDGDAQNLPKEALKKFTVEGSDFLTRLHLYKAFEEAGKGEQDTDKKEAERIRFAEKYYLRYETMLRIEEECKDLFDQLGHEEKAGVISDEAILKRCIYEGFKDDLLTRNGTQKNKDGKFVYSLQSEKTPPIAIDRDSVLSDGVASFVTAGGNPRNPIFPRMNQVIDTSWLATS